MDLKNDVEFIDEKNNNRNKQKPFTIQDFFTENSDRFKAK